MNINNETIFQYHQEIDYWILDTNIDFEESKNLIFKREQINQNNFKFENKKGPKKKTQPLIFIQQKPIFLVDCYHIEYQFENLSTRITNNFCNKLIKDLNEIFNIFYKTTQNHFFKIFNFL